MKAQYKKGNATVQIFGTTEKELRGKAPKGAELIISGEEVKASKSTNKAKEV